MKREKSCGAIVYRRGEAGYQILVLKHRFGGHWSFPKGHMEEGEHETQTALREVWEETGLALALHTGPRQTVEYYPRQGVKKLVVYFLGYPIGGSLQRQESEVSEVCWLDIDEAYRSVTFKNDRNLINWARRWLRRLERPERPLRGQCLKRAGEERPRNEPPETPEAL